MPAPDMIVRTPCCLIEPVVLSSVRTVFALIVLKGANSIPLFPSELLEFSTSPSI